MVGGCGRVAHMSEDVQRLPREDARQMLARLHDANQRIRPAFSDRQSRVRFRDQPVSDDSLGRVDIDPLDVGPGRHEANDGVIAKPDGSFLDPA